MSVWAAVSGWLSKLGAGAGPIAADAKIVDAAMAAVIKAAQDARSGSLTPVEALQAIDATLKALALVAPPVAQFESYVEAATLVAEVATNLGIIKTDPGLPLGKDSTNPYTDEPVGV